MQRFTAILAIVLSGAVHAADLTTDQQKFSYAMGVRLGQLLQAQEVTNLESAALAAGIDDALKGGELQLSVEQMNAAIQKRQDQMNAERQAKGQANLEAGKAFMAENGKRAGVTTLENGLQYEVLTEGKGESPKPDQTVRVHYRGTLIDGTQFDSSYDRGQPAAFALNAVIPGFREAIVLMKPGAKWKVYMPPELGYGDKGAGDTIGPNQTLVFEIELLEVR